MKNRNFAGLILVVIGVLFLMDNLTNLNFSLGDWWPTILIAIGLVQISNSKGTNWFSWFLVIIGGLFLIDNFGILKGISVWQIFVPLIIVCIGVSILFKGNERQKHHANCDNMNNQDYNTSYYENANNQNYNYKDTEVMNPSNTSNSSNQHSKGASSEDFLSGFALFSGVTITSYSKSLKGGNVSALFGGADIDLRNATIEPGTRPHINLNAMFGGVDIKVPSNWKLEIRSTPILGGVDNKTINAKYTDDNAPILTMNCTAIFGGIDIKN